MQLLAELPMLLVLLIAQYVASEDQEIVWKSFKTRFTNKYRGLSRAQENVRKQIFLDNVKRINEFNADPSKTFKLGVNDFTDLTLEEFFSTHTGLKSLPNITMVVRDPPSGVARRSAASLTTSYPNSLDYQNTGYVSAVKNQGSCGACWAFAASQAVEAQAFRLKGQIVSPSEQQMVDCSKNGINDGCNGGNQVLAFVYMSDGIMSANSYPYKSSQGICRANSSKSVTATFPPEYNNQGSYQGYYTDSSRTVVNFISYYRIIDSGNGDLNTSFASAVIKVLNEVGPIAIEVCAYTGFYGYSSGIYEASACERNRIDHAVLLVGYDISSSDPAQRYWIIKNSWGPSWGMSGYMRMRYGAGLIRNPSYPNIDPTATVRNDFFDEDNEFDFDEDDDEFENEDFLASAAPRLDSHVSWSILWPIVLATLFHSLLNF